MKTNTTPTTDLRAPKPHPTPDPKPKWWRQLWRWFTSLSRGWAGRDRRRHDRADDHLRRYRQHPNLYPGEAGGGEVWATSRRCARTLTLPKARKELKKHGSYTADPKSIDTVGGIYIPEENFIVCKQDDPKGHLVPLKVAKSATVELGASHFTRPRRAR